MIATRAMIVRRRRGLAAFAAACMLAFAVAWAHSGMAMDHMGTSAVVCVAVIDGALAVGAILLAPRLSENVRPFRALPRVAARSVFIVGPSSVPSRAGPARLQVFRL